MSILTIIILILCGLGVASIVAFFIMHMRDTTSINPLSISKKRLLQMKIAYEIKQEKELEDSYTVK